MEILSKLNSVLRNRKIRIILITLIGFFIRIPRNGQLTGLDAFTLSWYGWAIAKGTAHHFLIHPLSFIGAYPLSGYPILTELLLAMCILLTKNIYLSWYLTGFLIVGFTVSNSLLLVRSLEIPQLMGDIMILILITNPIFVLYNLGSISARGTFIAFFPLFLSLNIELLKKTSVINYLFSLFSMMIILTTHRISFLLIPVWILILIISMFFVIVDRSRIYNKLSLLVYNNRLGIILLSIVLYLSLGTLSTYIFNLDPNELGIPGFFNYQPGFLTFLKILLIQITNQGVSTIWSAICVLYCLVYSEDNLAKSIKQKQILVIIVLFGASSLFLFLPIAWYIGLLFPLPLAFISSYLLYSLLDKSTRIQLSFLIILSVGSILYYIGLISILPIYREIKSTVLKLQIFIGLISCLLIFIVLTIILINQFRTISAEKWYSLLVIFICLLMVNSTIYYNDTLTIATNSTFPKDYVTQEEYDVAEFLINQNIKGRILTSHFEIGRRLMGLTGLLFYEDDIGGSGLVTGYNNKSNILEKAKLQNITTWWQDAFIYDISETKGRINYIWFRIFDSHFYDPFVQNLFIEENTKYLIFKNDRTITYGNTFNGSIFITSILDQGIGINIYQTEHLTIYKLPDQLFTG